MLKPRAYPTLCLSLQMTGRTDREVLLSAVDLLPTLLERAGQALPAGYTPDGQSIVPGLMGKKFKRSKPIFWEWAPARNHPETWPHLGVREGPWKLLLNEKLGRAELYNIQEDWAEQRNWAREHPEVLAALSRKLKQWKQELPKAPPAHCLSAGRKTP